MNGLVPKRYRPTLADLPATENGTTIEKVLCYLKWHRDRYEEFRNKTVDEQWAAGAPYHFNAGIGQIATFLGMSENPVRRAVNKLSEQGHVGSRRCGSRGTHYHALNAADLAEKAKQAAGHMRNKMAAQGLKAAGIQLTRCYESTTGTINIHELQAFVAAAAKAGVHARNFFTVDDDDE